MSKSKLLFMFKRFVEIVISSIMFYSGFLFLYVKTKGRKQIPILYYHEIGNDMGILGSIAVRPEVFEMQMKYISRWYHVISIDDLADYIEGKIDLPPNPVVITFDGGYMGNYKNAYPVLKKYNIPATIYPVTGCINSGEVPWTMRLRYIIESSNTPQLTVPFPEQEKTFNLTTRNEKLSSIKEIKEFLYNIVPSQRDEIIQNIAHKLKVDLRKAPRNLLLSWDMIKKMNHEGLITFGSHTITHPMLLNIPKEVANHEIVQSKKDIENRINQTITSFCYPNGYLSEEIKHLVRDAGYRSALSTIHGLNSTRTDLFELKRISSGNSPFLCIFALQLSGILGNVKRCIKRIMIK